MCIRDSRQGWELNSLLDRPRSVRTGSMPTTTGCRADSLTAHNVTRVDAQVGQQQSGRVATGSACHGPSGMCCGSCLVEPRYCTPLLWPSHQHLAGPGQELTAVT